MQTKKKTHIAGTFFRALRLFGLRRPSAAFKFQDLN